MDLRTTLKALARKLTKPKILQQRMPRQEKDQGKINAGGALKEKNFA